MNQPQPYEVQKMAFDASRPYAVVATFRRFNPVVGRYADKTSAKRRARDLNHKTARARPRAAQTTRDPGTLRGEIGGTDGQPDRENRRSPEW